MPVSFVFRASTFALALACPFAFAVPARADGPSPSPSPAPSASAAPSPVPSPSPSPTPYKFVTFTGYGDAGVTSIGGSDQARFTTGTPSRVFDGSTGPFYDENGGRELAGPNDFVRALDLQNANVVLNLNGPVISAKFEGSFGTDADVIASNGQSRSGSNLTQAFVQYAKGPFKLQAGKFETEAGAELIESPLDTNYSRSYLFGYAIPFTHTGLRLTYVATPKLSLIAGVNDGWDDWKFAGKKKTLEGAISLTPSPAVTLLVDTYNGNDFAIPGNSAIAALPVYTNRMLYDGVLTVNVTSALTAIVNYDDGTQLPDASGAFATTYGGSARWNGVAGYLTYKFGPRYALSLRKETFHDANGFRTGVAQRLQSNTATLAYTPAADLIFRAEARLDTTDADDFIYRGYIAGPGAPDDGRPHQASLGLEAIVTFP